MVHAPFSKSPSIVATLYGEFMSGLRRGENDVASVNPYLVAEADGWDPTSVAGHSNQTLSWKCTLGHQYSATPNSRSSGSGCPFCSGRRVLVGFNDLNSQHPEVARQMLDGDPKTVTPKSQKTFQWRCEKSHVWLSKVSERTRGSGCPVCAGRTIEVGTLPRDHPEIARQAHGWDPSSVMVQATRKYSWCCELSHVWDATLQSRLKGTSCPFCKGIRVLPGFNDLLTTHPELAGEAHGWDPRSFIAGTGKKLEWKCHLGHIWITRGAERVAGKGCPFCAGQRVWPGSNDLATVNPALAVEANGWDPTQVTAGLNSKRAWKCERGHKWEATIGSRNSGVGCPFCSGKRPIVGETDLGTTHPELSMELVSADSATLTAGSERKVDWECHLGHRWSASVVSRTNRHSGCPYCSNQAVLAGFNDLASSFPELALEAIDWDPSTVVSGSAKKLKWKCSAGHTYLATPVSRTTRGTGCPTCAKYGFSPALDGYIYLLEQKDWKMQQIGITNYLEQRLRQHARHLWEPLDVLGPMTGDLALAWEKSILVMLSSRGVRLGHGGDSVKFSGFTEAWPVSDFKATSLRDLANLVRCDEIDQWK